MNFVAHVLVAERVTGDRSVGLLAGAAAPDLTRMAGVRPTPEPAEDAATGIALHHRTDAAFHDLAWFRTLNAGLAADLRRAGVRRGPARGAAHVLVELLLDGTLLADGHDGGAFTATWSALAARDDDVLALVDDDDGTWPRFLGELTRRLEPARYADPAYAADRVVGALGRRPRLALDDTEAAALHEAAHPVAEAVREAAADVLAATADLVRAAPDGAAVRSA